MKFFFDHNLSPKIARALNELRFSDEWTVTALRDRFPSNVTDAEWLRTLAAEGDWVILSADQRIVQNRHEREAWLDAGLTTFFLPKAWLNLRLWDQAWRLVKWWPAIVDQARRIQPGAAFLVPVGGSKLQQLTVIR